MVTKLFGNSRLIYPRQQGQYSVYSPVPSIFHYHVYATHATHHKSCDTWVLKHPNSPKSRLLIEELVHTKNQRSTSPTFLCGLNIDVFVSFPLIIIVNCVPRVSLYGALSYEVCVFNLPTLPKVWPFMVQCLFMHCSTRGWPLRKRCAQRLCKGLPTTTKNILSCTLCDIVSCLNFFLVEYTLFKFKLKFKMTDICISLRTIHMGSVFMAVSHDTRSKDSALIMLLRFVTTQYDWLPPAEGNLGLRYVIYWPKLSVTLCVSIFVWDYRYPFCEFYHFPPFRLHEYLKTFHVNHTVLFILHSWYYAWWPDNICHDVDLSISEYTGPSTRKIYYTSFFNADLVFSFYFVTG